MRVAETKGGIHLRMGNTGYFNQFIVRNTWISALARPHCGAACYSNNNVCTNNKGIQIGLATHGSGEKFPLKSPPTNFDVICVPPSIDASNFFFNI
jgi:hypothetical protein